MLLALSPHLRTLLVFHLHPLASRAHLLSAFPSAASVCPVPSEGAAAITFPSARAAARAFLAAEGGVDFLGLRAFVVFGRRFPSSAAKDGNNNDCTSTNSTNSGSNSNSILVTEPEVPPAAAFAAAAAAATAGLGAKVAANVSSAGKSVEEEERKVHYVKRKFCL